MNIILNRNLLNYIYLNILYCVLYLYKYIYRKYTMYIFQCTQKFYIYVFVCLFAIYVLCLQSLFYYI